MDPGASYLAVIGEREALAWVLRESRMAFPATRRSEVDRLSVGDELFLLTTRGCFHNPGRDRTRVIGRAVVATPVVPLDPPVELVGRDFPRACDLQLTALAPYLTGIELRRLVPYLDAFPDSTTWSIRLRRALVPLSERDAELLTERMGDVASAPEDWLDGYLERIKPVARP